MTRTRRRTLRGRGKGSWPSSAKDPEERRKGFGPKPTTSPAPKWTEEERRKALETFQRDTVRNHEKASKILEPLVIGRKYNFKNTSKPGERGSTGTLTSKGDTSVNFNINRVNYHIANPWDYIFVDAPDDEVDELSDSLSGLRFTPHLVLGGGGGGGRRRTRKHRSRRRHAKPRTRGRTA